MTEQFNRLTDSNRLLLQRELDAVNCILFRVTSKIGFVERQRWFDHVRMRVPSGSD